jgi:hypothetical protein
LPLSTQPTENEKKKDDDDGLITNSDNSVSTDNESEKRKRHISKLITRGGKTNIPTKTGDALTHIRSFYRHKERR